MSEEIKNIHDKKFMPESWNGKNKHSVWTRCYNCQTFGMCMPQDAVCGNCCSTDTMQFWDVETIKSELSEAEKRGEERGFEAGRLMYKREDREIPGPFGGIRTIQYRAEFKYETI